MKKKLKFEIDLDENHLPENISMNSSDSSGNENNIKALFVSAWQAKKKETLRIDLWTKDMPVNEMFIFYHQSLLSMAQTLEKSTGHERLSAALLDYCDFFAEQTQIKKE
ncbi:MAG: gliding motility protein GldC [Flavobacteriales bacterium]|nr:gliding motility protein GldC [Flavobacteriales bacterium]|tara:strand:- start:86526 stop:86852 length:327 start_codon:yes stop_codon:yes gene_type:complete